MFGNIVAASAFFSRIFFATTVWREKMLAFGQGFYYFIVSGKDAAKFRGAMRPDVQGENR
jgi:hypothetical protein